jgi:hypothetical protein
MENRDPGWAIYLRRWNGKEWAELGGSASGAGLSGDDEAFYYDLTVDASGNPIVLWNSSAAAGNPLYLLRWDGSMWMEFGGSGTGTGLNRYGHWLAGGTVRVDRNGNPVVSSMAKHPKVKQNSEIYLIRWNGRAWEELGGSASEGGISSTPTESLGSRIALDDKGHPIVVWAEKVGDAHEVYLKRWNGSSWVEVGESATGGGISRSPRGSSGAMVALDGSGRIVVGWTEDTGNEKCEAYLRRWNGKTWEELGESASAGGISRSDRSSMFWGLALDPSGEPVACWDSFALGTNPGDSNSATYLRRWNGKAWEELGRSASGAGLSRIRNPGKPSVAIDRKGHVVVAFEAWPEKSQQIYVLQWVKK